MRKSFFALSLLFLTLLAGSTAAQTPSSTPAAGKIGLVNTQLFAEAKEGAGITRYKAALKSVNDQLKADNDEIRTHGTRYETLRTEFQRLSQANPPTAPAILQQKAAEIQELETTIKRKQEDVRLKSERLSARIIDPMTVEVRKAMAEYAKQKGYAVILDGLKLEEAGMLIGFDDKYDVTQDFIRFFNARPATAARNP